MFTIKHSQSRGRSLHSTQQISPGTSIYTELPYASCPDSVSLSKICSNCLLPASRQCTACKKVKYCSQECQKLDWWVHKKECKALGRVEKVPTSLLRLAVRVYFKEEMGKTDSSNSQSVESLQSNISKFPPSTLQNFQILSYLFPSYTSSTSTSPNGPDPSHIESLLAKLSTNTFCPTEPDLTPIAVGVYLTLAMVNHDCDPNCFVLFSGGKAVLRNLKFINEGEELTISYIDPLLSTSSRKQELLSRYFFECTCSRCTSPSHSPSLQLTRSPSISQSDIQKSLDELSSSTSPQKCLTNAKEFTLKVTSTVSVSDELCVNWLKPLQLLLIDKLNSVGIEFQQFAVFTFTISELLLTTYQEILIRGRKDVYDPIIAVQLFIVAKLARLNDTLEKHQVVQRFVEAVKYLEVTHGFDNSLTREAVAMLEEEKIIASSN